MAYLNVHAFEPATVERPQVAAPADAGRLSALEWSVVALARNDRMASLRRPGRMAIALGNLFGVRQNPQLADERLEALRRMAVLSWLRGYAVDPGEVQAFVAAGFTLAQYDTMLASIGAERLRATSRR